ncbi:hypothetical protein BDP27DRAFT_1356859 [Rhodocollybia butyracea]|uniref:Uncharacterized protein n=1 Tax=Rhodocollybia butyracea TaxID=206335 RepID=A0A9P5UGA4_9AGAR|nr:hypothetical protein BDP27DRAFT_1356859 [Rhodocollybia butyracea]
MDEWLHSIRHWLAFDSPHIRCPDKVVQPRPEWMRSGCRAERQDQDSGNDIQNRLQGQGNSGTLVKLLATPPTHHQGCPRRRGSKVRGIAKIGPRYRRENSPRYVRGRDQAELAGIRQNGENKESSENWTEVMPRPERGGINTNDKTIVEKTKEMNVGALRAAVGKPKVLPIKASEMYIGRDKIENGVSDLPEAVGTIGAVRDHERSCSLYKQPYLLFIPALLLSLPPKTVQDTTATIHNDLTMTP